MPWSAFFARLRRERQLRALDAQLKRALASRKADRLALRERALRGHQTRRRNALTRDPLINAKAQS